MYRINNLFLQTKVLGNTGLLHLNNFGNRVDISLDVKKVSVRGLSTVGQWNANNGLLMRESSFQDKDDDPMTSLFQRRPLVISTVLVSFIMFCK